jgi:putative heme-binding domain-containing protein
MKSRFIRSVRRAVSVLPVVSLAIAGASLAAQGSRDEHPGQYTQADIVAGSRLYGEQCSSCHGATGGSVAGIDLRRGRFKTASSDEDLKRVITKGVPNTAMPAVPLSDTELTAVLAYVRAGLDVKGRALMIGNAARGKTVFDGKGACGTCHRVKDLGPAGLAPDLTEVGTQRTAQSLHQSLVDPSSVMMPINRPVRIVTRAGQTINGRRLNEDTYSVQLINDQGRLQSVLKSDIREYQVITVSPMPSFSKTLTSEEIADLVAYLQTLRG